MTLKLDEVQQQDLALCFCERGELIFAENGAVRLLTDQTGRTAREMDDFEVVEETRDRRPELAAVSTLITAGSTAVVIFGAHGSQVNPYTYVFSFAALALLLLFSIVCAFGCYKEAVANDEVGSKKNNLPQPAHITGLGGAVAIILVVVVAVIFTVGQLRPYGFDLPESVGNGTFIALASLFTLVFLSSRLPAPPSLTEILDKLREWTSGAQRLGIFLSRIDAGLVFGIAPLSGVTLDNPILRYTVLLTQVLCGAALAWYCPSPFGLISAVWVFVLVFAVVRRWGWIEHVRAVRIQNLEGAEQRRIGKIVDLRDEAMVGLLLLVLVTPLAMRQVHLAVPAKLGFTVDGNSINNVFAWTGFFGIELLKALPFLDWADIYGARNGARIHTDGPISMHTVFVARMVIDLVFLAALVQWVSISVAIEKNKRDFLSKRNGVVCLDERIERNHLSRLVKIDSKGNFVPTNSIALYTHYDTLALARLRLRHKHDSRLLAAIREISKAAGKTVEVPSEQLLEESYRPFPRPDRLLEILKVVEQERDFDIENMLLARSELNRKGNLENERKKLVQLLVRHIPPSKERDIQFADILSGTDSDSLRDVRRLVIDTLVRNAKRNPQVVSYLIKAAELDVSKAVREHALRSMARFGLKSPAAQASTKLA